MEAVGLCFSSSRACIKLAMLLNKGCDKFYSHDTEIRSLVIRRAQNRNFQCTCTIIVGDKFRIVKGLCDVWVQLKLCMEHSKH